MKKHKNGFTLAEVLITLVIIGIIAAMTIPTLMNKTNEQETVVAVKKAYSTISQAYQRMIAENGEIYPQNLGSGEVEASKNFAELMIPFLSVQKNCGQDSGTDCWSTQNGGMYKNFNGTDWRNMKENSNQYYLVRLNDGTSLSITGYPAYEEKGSTDVLKHTIGLFHIDVNGDKGPNTKGKDVFSFWVTKYGVIPYGLGDSTMDGFSTCRSLGSACTAWVIAKGNMDYLRKEVSW